MQGWLRNPAFDSVFIIGLSAIALAAGAIVLNDPTRFRTVLILDLWLLGFHHVISTYTRLAFDAESFRQHKALVLYLPIGVFLATGLIGASFGAQALTTIYLYWQWYHYTRQSEGISKAYARKSEHHAAGPCLITKITFWIVPLDGLVNLSFKAPGVFLGLPVYTLPVPFELVFIMDCAAVVCLALWSYRQIQAMQNGTLSIPYVLYLTSHFVIYYVAYVLIHFVDTGWLVINIWHNAQYIDNQPSGTTKWVSLSIWTMSCSHWVDLHASINLSDDMTPLLTYHLSDARYISISPETLGKSLSSTKRMKLNGHEVIFVEAIL